MYLIKEKDENVKNQKMYVSTVNFNDACGPRLTRLPTSLTKVTQNIDFPFFRPAAEKFFSSDGQRADLSGV